MSICEEWVKTRGSFLKLCQSPIAITFPGGVTEVISVCFGGTSRLHFPFTKLLQLHALAEDGRMVVNVVHQVSQVVHVCLAVNLDLLHRDLVEPRSEMSRHRLS